MGTPLSTAGTYLMYKATEAGSYTKLCDILNYPDTGSPPNKLDTTDLSQKVMKTFIFGLQESPDLTFEANYDETIYATIAALNGTYSIALYFGDNTGTDGKYGWTGGFDVYINGGGVDEVRKMTVVCSATTAIAPIA